jgi:arylsulfatase B
MKTLITIFTLVACFVGQSSHAAPEKRPNVLILVADDLGWRDIGYHDSDIKTPVLDKLAAGGARLDRHYVWTTCSPTRCGLLTGQNPARFGILGPIGDRSELSLPLGTRTLAQTLKDQGYTTALFGKWHLGLRPEVGPRQFGFDETYGYLHGQIDPYTHLYKNGDRTWHRNDKFIDEKGHATDLIADEAVRFVSAKRDNPFFLWVAFSVPHHPLQEEDKWVAPYKDAIKDPSRRVFAASVTHMDAAIGRIIDELRKRDELKNTIILFTSDNGGQQNYLSKTEYGGKFEPNPTLGNNLPLRGWKGELYEGGIRVPALIHWEGKIKPHVVKETISYLDWFPTLTDLCRVKFDSAWKRDGRDISPLVLDDKTRPYEERPLYWKTGRSSAVLDGDWKLIVSIGKKAGPPELFNLKDDPDEKMNLAEKEPKKLELMKQLLAEQQKMDADSKK